MTSEKAREDLGKRICELTQENARLAEAVAARDAFLAVAAHELRNPMTPIINRVSMLRRAAAKGGMPAEKLDRDLDQIEWLITLFVKRATTLLDVSRITTGKLRLESEEVDVCEVTHAVVGNFGPLAQNAGCSITLNVPSGGLIVTGEWLSIEQILDNLVSNAIKYAAGKPITITASADKTDRIARITVSDGGPGISEDSQARIFERFERAVPVADHSGGFGVGLWIVKRLVEAMDGTIAVTSTAGAGSTFSITLPLKSEKESA